MMYNYRYNKVCSQATPVINTAIKDEDKRRAYMCCVSLYTDVRYTHHRNNCTLYPNHIYNAKSKESMHAKLLVCVLPLLVPSLVVLLLLGRGILRGGCGSSSSL